MNDTAKKTGPEFSAAEKAAMKDRAKELKASAKKADLRKACEDAIAELDGLDRELAEKLHAIVLENAPGLDPKTYYGMPAYAGADGKVVCFFQPASKFGVRYATFGFETPAQLDDGSIWPTAWAITELTQADEKMLAGLVRRAAG